MGFGIMKKDRALAELFHPEAEIDGVLSMSPEKIKSPRLCECGSCFVKVIQGTKSILNNGEIFRKMAANRTKLTFRFS